MEPECAPTANRRRVYRYGQPKSVVVYNLKVETDSDAYADNKVYEYLEKKLRDVADALAQATGEGEETSASATCWGRPCGGGSLAG